MDTDKKGIDMRRFKMEVKFHLPGLRRNYPINVTFIRMIKEHPEYLREGVKIGSFYGEFPTSLWNGGRNSRPDMCDKKYIDMVIKQMNDWGIPIRYTYTNMLIEEEDLSDPHCNYCLQAAHNGMNGVIVVSPLLEEYVRKNYPKMSIVSSTCKCIKGVEGVNAELAKDYTLVVLDYNMNNKFDELEKITDKGRCEVLVNALCAPNCPARYTHYKNVSRNQKILAKSIQNPGAQVGQLEPWKFEGCAGGRSVYAVTNSPNFVSPEDIWEKYVPMGFRNFKLEGRNDHLLNVVELYCMYLIKPEYQGWARFQMYGKLENLKLIQINMI